MMQSKSTSKVCLLVGILSWLSCVCPNLMAQRISFGLFAGEGIIIDSPQGINPELNFNEKQRVITSNSGMISIGRGEGDPYVVYRIQAAEGFDLLIDIDQPNFLWKDGNPSLDKSIPFDLRVAYNNQKAPDDITANMGAIEAPIGVSSIIIPVSRSTSTAPEAPPAPLSGGISTRPKSTLYLFLHGILGPVANVKPGIYTAEIVINVTYANYEGL